MLRFLSFAVLVVKRGNGSFLPGFRSGTGAFGLQLRSTVSTVMIILGKDRNDVHVTDTRGGIGGSYSVRGITTQVV